MTRIRKHPLRAWLRREIIGPLDTVYGRLDDDLQDDYVGARLSDSGSSPT